MTIHDVNQITTPNYYLTIPMLSQFIQRVWNPSATAPAGKTIPLHPALPPFCDDTTMPAPVQPTTRMVKLIRVTAGNNNKYYEMCENDDDTFTVHYGRVGGIRSKATHPMAHWDKKFREKVAKGYVENLTIEPVTDSHVLKLIRRMMGADVHRLEAVFSVRQGVSDAAFNAYMHRQTNRKTMAFWHGNFSKDEYVAIYEVHVGNQIDTLRPEPKHMRFDNNALKGSHAPHDSVFARQGVSLQKNEFIVYHPAQCTVRYLVRIKL